ncbi:hypothetical protein QR680_003199 [Steinernema hermaphroditum]|uniref:Fibronectin type-III domain-containing protein n=1 Tax=Steinernema hermaphroditum TaxID=289476 RepID=A0AA39LJU6_9BILA|nr:hypothetical protein QR680_003199 [Steinernema hermaphroditum]
MRRLLYVSLLIYCHISAFEEDLDYLDVNVLEATEVTNDHIFIKWMLPQAIGEVATSLWLRASTITGVASDRNSVLVKVSANQTDYKFERLFGNTTYRVSIEAFAGQHSLWYTSTLITTSLAGELVTLWLIGAHCEEIDEKGGSSDSPLKLAGF